MRNGASSFYKSDALGSTRALTNASGTTTGEQTTDAFGNTVSASGSTPSPFGFAGQFGYKTDSETGLMLLGHRYYDPSTGRFLSRDPIRDGYNWYTYCNNDPVNAVDPEGLWPWEHLDWKEIAHQGWLGGWAAGGSGLGSTGGVAIGGPIGGWVGGVAGGAAGRAAGEATWQEMMHQKAENDEYNKIRKDWPANYHPWPGGRSPDQEAGQD